MGLWSGDTVGRWNFGLVALRVCCFRVFQVLIIHALGLSGVGRLKRLGVWGLGLGA